MSLAVRYVICSVLAVAGGVPVAGAAFGLTPVVTPDGEAQAQAQEFADDANADILRFLQHGAEGEDIAAIPELVAVFPTSQDTMQHAILRIFSQLLAVANPEDRAAMVETATGALASPSAPVRVQALDMLGRDGDEALVPLAIPMLEDEDWAVRYQALYVLGRFAEAGGHPEIFTAIGALVDDEDERLRVAARSIMRLAPGGQ